MTTLKLFCCYDVATYKGRWIWLLYINAEIPNAPNSIFFEINFFSQINTEYQDTLMCKKILVLLWSKAYVGDTPKSSIFRKMFIETVK